jgi:VCBS repeat-containing protein
VASSDSYSTAQGTALTAAAPGVLGNDTDPEGATLTAQLVSGTSHGTLALNSNGSFTYTPVTGYVGSDSFTYRASDGALTSGSATVSLTVTSTGNVLFADNFTRSISPPAPLSPWTGSMGTWAVTSGVLNGSGAAFDYSHIYYAPAPLWDNYAVEAGFKYASAAFGGGLGCRLNPATGAQYAAWVYPDNSVAGHNVLVLGKMWDWTTYSGTPMAQVNLTSVGTGWHTLKMVCNGNRIQVYYDGTAKIDVTDNNYDSRPPYLTGGIGMAMWTYDTLNTMSVDTVVVSTLAP